MIEDPFRRERAGADGLREGYFSLRRQGRVDVPIRIWFGPPLDPDTGEILDRSWRWQVQVYGVDASDPDYPPLIWGREMESLSDIWPQCARFPIDKVDYEFRVERANWSEQFDANDPFGSRTGKVDPLTVTLPLFDD